MDCERCSFSKNAIPGLSQKDSCFNFIELQRTACPASKVPESSSTAQARSTLTSHQTKDGDGCVCTARGVSEIRNLIKSDVFVI
jgi:hypothetical protein